MAKKQSGSIELGALKAAAAARAFKPVYLLHGEEPWFIDEAEAALTANALEEHERDFNLTVVYGKDSSFEEIINAAKRFPMMAERQVVVVREAQDLDCWKREDRRERMEQYLAQPQPTTVLVFCHKYKALTSTLRIYKAIAKVGEVLAAGKLSDQELSTWISNNAAQRGCNLSPEVMGMLGEYLGSDLAKVEHAIEKLHFMVGDQTVVKPEHVERFIGISKDYNVFELQEAIASRDHLRAQRIVNYFAANPKDNNINMVIGFLFNFWSKLLIYHSLPDKSNQSLGSHLQLPWSAFTTIRAAGANYNERKVVGNISVLRNLDRTLKGRVDSSMTDADQYRQLVHDLMN